MSFAQKRPSSAGSSRRPVSRASSRGTNRRPMSAGSSRSRASSRNSIIDQYDNAVASKRRELLVKLLQRETMKEAMFKDMQLRKGGGIMPTEEVDDKARQMAEDLVNGNVDILTEELLNQIGTEREVDDNGRKDARPPVPPLRLDTAAVKAENKTQPSNQTYQRPMSARADSRRSNRSNSRSSQRPRSLSPRPQSASSARSSSSRSSAKKNWSPMAEAIAKLYERTSHLRKDSGNSTTNRPPRPKSAGSIRGRTSKNSNKSLSKNPSRPSSNATPVESGYALGEEVKARSHSRQEYHTARVIGKNSDGSYDLRYEIEKKNNGSKGGRKVGSHIPSVSGIASVGIKRLKDIVREKIEQRCRSSSTGSMATVNPHVLKKMFRRFDTSGDGSLDRDEFHAAMRSELGLVNISDDDMNALMDEYDEDGDGEVTYEEFTKQIFVKDFSDKRGSVIDFPSNHNSYDKDENLNKLMEEAKNILLVKSKHLRKIFRNMSMIDANDDGEVRKPAFIAFLRNNNIGIGKEEAMNHLFAKIDADKSGSISFTEFAEALNHAGQEKEDGNFFCGGGRKQDKRGPGNMQVKIGRRRLHSMLLDKIEQKAKSNSSFARTSEHQLRKMFKEFDEDDSGELDKTEFRNALKWKLGLMNVAAEDIDELFDYYDKDKGGGIDVNEFIAQVLPKDFTDERGMIDLPCTSKGGLKGDTPEERLFSLKLNIKEQLIVKGKGMREAFRKMGGAGDGEIDKYEFKACLRNNHIGVGNEKIVDKLFKEIDSDNSGKISFKEFAAVMNKDTTKAEGNFFVGGGKNIKKKRFNNIASIGYKRLLEIVKDKIQQKVRGRSTGSFATVNPNVMKVMFHSFDSSGDGELSRDEFANALRSRLGLMNISTKDMNELMNHFDEDNDGTITYDEFIAKVLPPEFVHGGGGIMDFESDDPDFKGCVTKKEQLFALKKQIKKQLLTKAKNMREMFRRMGGAGDGEVDEYEFKTALRNANIGIGHENIMGILFKEIDSDHSGHIDFKEFAANLNKDETKQEGNFFVGGGRSNKRFIPQVMKTSIGLKRTWEILKTKIEQRCKSASGGVFAMTSPHVLAKMFHEFDQDGGGSLSRDEFERALREKLGKFVYLFVYFLVISSFF
jgi:Ca2+-binding EF-hand superfamily protein